MRTQLLSLSKNIIDRIVKVEAEVMIPILAKSGIAITLNEIKDTIYADPHQEVIIAMHDDEPLAWIRFAVEDRKIFIKSIQLDGNPFAFRHLLREASVALKNLGALNVESVVQKANARSLALHEKLGFDRTKDGTHAIRYSIDGGALKANIDRFFED